MTPRFWILSLPQVARMVLCYENGPGSQAFGVMNGVDYGDPRLSSRRDYIAEAWRRLEAKCGEMSHG